MAQQIVHIAGQIVDLLDPLSSEERHRVIQASLALLGETPLALRTEGGPETSTHENGGVDRSGLAQRARVWIKQNGLGEEELQQVFHWGPDSVELIAAVPGKNRAEQVVNAYILTGLSNLLSRGDATFDDKVARARCEAVGCYDSTNHSKYMKTKGNNFTGSKEKGWVLTGPGLGKGGTLVKELAKATS